MQCALKKWLARPRRLIGENEVRVVEHYSGDIPYGLRFHQVDELGVHRLIANTMSDNVHPRAHDRFGIIEVVDMGGYPQAVLVRLVNHGGIYFWLKLGHQPAGAIEPDLDHVGLARGHLTDRLTCHLYGVRSRDLVLVNWNDRRRWLATDHTNSLVGSKEVGTGKPACVQLRTQFVEQRPVQAERHHSGDAEALELFQLPRNGIAVEFLRRSL